MTLGGTRDDHPPYYNCCGGWYPDAQEEYDAHTQLIGQLFSITRTWGIFGSLEVNDAGVAYGRSFGTSG